MANCWQSKNVVQRMLMLSKPIDKSWHWIPLNEYLTLLKDMSTLLDLGCGTAALGDCDLVKDNFVYTGADQEHILHPLDIENKIVFDAYTTNYAFISNYDIIVANAFIDVLHNASEILEKILHNISKYMILHRQVIDDLIQPSEHESYGGVSYQSVISPLDLQVILNKTNTKILETHQFKNEYKSILIGKK